MKSIYIGAVFIMAAGIMLSSCEKDISTYSNDPRVYFFERGSDLNQSKILFKSFSFLTFPQTVTKDTLLIRVKVMGKTSSKDRIIRGKTLEEGTTAKEGTHFDFIDGIIKADSIMGYLPVVLYRTADIANASVKLNLTIAETVDFKPGVGEDLTFAVEWSDDVVKPSNWDGFVSLSFYFGPYSDTKWRFIILQTGISNFPLAPSARVEPLPGEYTGAAMLDIQLRLKKLLVDYNNTHDPDLTDEFGQLVTFPK